MVPDEATLKENPNASLSKSDAPGTTDRPGTPEDEQEEASAMANAEQSENLAVQGIQNLKLDDEVKNKVSETSAPNTDADLETNLDVKDLEEPSDEDELVIDELIDQLFS